MVDQTKNPSTQLSILSNELEKKVTFRSKEQEPTVGTKQPLSIMKEDEETIIITDCKPTKTTFMSADGEVFEVEEAVANELGIVKAFILESGCNTDRLIPLPNVEGLAFSKVIEYVSKQLEFRAKHERVDVEDVHHGWKNKKALADEVKEFEAGFVKQLDNDFLKVLILAADYLNANQMLGLLKQTAADRVKNKSVAFARKFFGVESDYTAEEEIRLRDENLWAYESVEEDDD